MGYGLSADPSMRDVKERRETWLGGRQRTVGSFRVRQADGWAGGRNERGFTPLSQPRGAAVLRASAAGGGLEGWGGAAGADAGRSAEAVPIGRRAGQVSVSSLGSPN